MHLKVKIDQIPKGRLVKGPYKPIWRDCAMYFSITVCVSCPIGLSWGLVVPWHIAGILFVGVTVAHKLLVSREDGNIRHRWHLGVGGKHGKHPTQLAYCRFILQLVIPMFFFFGSKSVVKGPQDLKHHPGGVCIFSPLPAKQKREKTRPNLRNPSWFSAVSVLGMKLGEVSQQESDSSLAK